MPSLDSLNTLKPLKVGDQTYHYFSLTEPPASWVTCSACPCR